MILDLMIWTAHFYGTNIFVASYLIAVILDYLAMQTKTINGIIQKSFAICNS